MDDSFDEELFGESADASQISDNDKENREESRLNTEQIDLQDDKINCILELAMKTQTYSENDIVSIANAVTKLGSDISANYSAQNIQIMLGKLASIEWKRGLKYVVEMITAAAIHMYVDMNEDTLWKVLKLHIDQTCYCVQECIRVNGCLAIDQCLRHVNERIELEGDDDEEDNFLASDQSNNKSKFEKYIPRDLIDRWAKVLSHRRSDKASAVRVHAVTALASLPHTTLIDYHKNEFIPNNLIISALRDIDVKVRESAIKSVSLLSFDDIETTINALRMEEKNEICRLFAAKLISQVHVMSFSPEQRASLLKFLYHSKDPILNRMGRERLIPRWEEEQDDESSLNSLFDPSDEDAIRIYVRTLFMDDLNKSDSSWEFVETMKDENVDMLTGDNWDRSFTNQTASELSYGLLLLECVFDVLESKNELSRCLTRLVPTLSDVCRSLKKISSSWLSGGSSSGSGEEKLMMRILNMAKMYKESDSEARSEWESLLRYLILSPSIKPSRCLIEYSINQLINQFCSSDDDIDRVKEWAVQQMNTFLFSNSNQDEGEEDDQCTNDEFMKWRCSLIILSLIKTDGTINKEMKELTRRLINEIFVSQWDAQREVACAIMCIMGCSDKEWMEVHMDMIVAALEHEIEEVKITALKGLTDLICLYTPHTIANIVYRDWNEELISREYKLYQLMDEYSNPTMKSSICLTGIQSCLRIMDSFHPLWPSCIYNLLLFTTRDNTTNESINLSRAINEWIEKETKLVSARVLLCHSMYSLLERQKSNPYKCSIASTVAKMITLCKENDESKKDEVLWRLVCIILDSIIDDPENELNRQLVIGMQGLRVDNGIDFVQNKMKIAIDRLDIFEQPAVGKMLIKVLDKIDEVGKNRKRRCPLKSSVVKKRMKKIKDEDDDGSDILSDISDVFTFTD